MYKREIIQDYVNNFRINMSIYLKPGLGILCDIYPIESEGAILVFTLGLNINNKDTYMKIEKKVNDSLKKIPQKAFGGNLEGFKFGGTNLITEDNRIIIIKGEDTLSDWNDKSAKNDVQRLVDPKGRT